MDGRGGRVSMALTWACRRRMPPLQCQHYRPSVEGVSLTNRVTMRAKTGFVSVSLTVCTHWNCTFVPGDTSSNGG